MGDTASFSRSRQRADDVLAKKAVGRSPAGARGPFCEQGSSHQVPSLRSLRAQESATSKSIFFVFLCSSQPWIVLSSTSVLSRVAEACDS